jgi:hypothetical protein
MTRPIYVMQLTHAGDGDATRKSCLRVGAFRPEAAADWQSAESTAAPRLDRRQQQEARLGEDLKKLRHVTVEQSGPTELKPCWNQDAQTIARQMAANMTRDKISHLFALAMDALKTKQAAT